MIDINVPMGISLFGCGTMTVLSSFVYLQWLPLCETKTNPKDFKTDMIWEDVCSLGTNDAFAYEDLLNRDVARYIWAIVKI